MYKKNTRRVCTKKDKRHFSRDTFLISSSAPFYKGTWEMFPLLIQNICLIQLIPTKLLIIRVIHKQLMLIDIYLLNRILDQLNNQHATLYIFLKDCRLIQHNSAHLRPGYKNQNAFTGRETNHKTSRPITLLRITALLISHRLVKKQYFTN